MKPENVLIGRKSHQKRNVLHVIDFGLAKPYIDSETKKHIQFAENRAITGRATIRIKPGMKIIGIFSHSPRLPRFYNYVCSRMQFFRK